MRTQYEVLSLAMEENYLLASWLWDDGEDPVGAMYTWMLADTQRQVLGNMSVEDASMLVSE